MRSILSALAIAAIVAGAGCGDGGDDADASANRPQIVVTTSILGDVVRNVVGEQADVDVIMPTGADPHEFAASTRQAEAMEEADVLVVNGAGFEQGLQDVIDAAADGGTPVFTFSDHVTIRTLDGQGGAADDPHLWTDPTMIADAVRQLGDVLATLTAVDGPAVQATADAYATDLDDLDAAISTTLGAIPTDRRVLVTNHESLGYFAARYDLRVIGAVIPSLTTNASASAADLEDLADLIRAEGVPAIFAETTQPTELAAALADEVGGDVQVVELYTESLGEPGSDADTYVGMMRTNALLIAGALA